VTHCCRPALPFMDNGAREGESEWEQQEGVIRASCTPHHWATDHPSTLVFHTDVAKELGLLLYATWRL